MKKFIFLLFLVSCSAKNVDKNSNNEFFDFNMDLNFEEFEKLLIKYDKAKGYPDINS
tara:strand:+ start:117 stop:287 length:171 start_codon:yes stop_codon:yes gene_type:complete